MALRRSIIRRGRCRRLALVVTVAMLVAALSSSWHDRGGATQAALLRRRRLPAAETPVEASQRPVIEAEPTSGEEQLRLVNAALVELQVESTPWRVVKLMVPVVPEVAQWWSDVNDTSFSFKFVSTLTGAPQIHVQAISDLPLKVEDVQVDGVFGMVRLPDDAVLEGCRVGNMRVTAGFKPLSSLGAIRGLLVMCPVRPQPSSSVDFLDKQPWPFFRLLLRFFLMPGLLLLLPGILSFPTQPGHLIAGVFLTMASVICLSCVITALILIVQKHCVKHVRRWQRLLRLRGLMRRALNVRGAYGEGSPCCICLGDFSYADPLIVLLPCRHALHRECYGSWVGADSYPSHELICPLCRCRAQAIGKLGP
mmetsp:Transcript_144576/g.277456  ORF Transcript_144576/g.277456 Transcript_144576/m.277456 type:complete len:366 (-) Transcript_144576:103-1200(-)